MFSGLNQKTSTPEYKSIHINKILIYKIKITKNKPLFYNHSQQKTIKEYGSFQNYLDTLDKTDNYSIVIKVLSK
jgi:hypothetical protein